MEFSLICYKIKTIILTSVCEMEVIQIEVG